MSALASFSLSFSPSFPTLFSLFLSLCWNKTLAYIGISFSGFGFNNHRNIFKVLEGERKEAVARPACNCNPHRPFPRLCLIVVLEKGVLVVGVGNLGLAYWV